MQVTTAILGAGRAPKLRSYPFANWRFASTVLSIMLMVDLHNLREATLSNTMVDRNTR